MVMMIKVTTEPSRAGSMASFSSNSPMATVTATAAAMASGIGRPSPRKNTVPMPPSMTNSPWAKLITWLAL